MASVLHSLCPILYFALFFLPNPTFSADAPDSYSPSPSPQFPPDAISQSPASPAPSPAFRASPVEYDGSAPSPVADAAQSHLGDGDLNRRDESDGMSGGKKAGIAIGVVAAACAVGLGAVVYKKRQRNIRRARYSYTDRRDFM